MGWSTRIGGVGLVAIILGAPGDAGAEGGCTWLPVLSVGPEWSRQGKAGGEAALLWIRAGGATANEKVHAIGGLGPVAGADTRAAYLEAEAVLLVGPHATGGDEVPMLFLTAGTGPAFRWRDGTVGLQGTLSFTVLFLPVTVHVRGQLFARDPRTDVTAGVMIKIPIPLAR